MEKVGHKGVLSYSLYPGRVPTNIAQNISRDEMKAAGRPNIFEITGIVLMVFIRMDGREWQSYSKQSFELENHVHRLSYACCGSI